MYSDTVWALQCCDMSDSTDHVLRWESETESDDTDNALNWSDEEENRNLVKMKLISNGIMLTFVMK